LCHSGRNHHRTNRHTTMELTVENNVVVVSLSVDQDSGYSAAAYARRAEAAADEALSATSEVASNKTAAELAAGVALSAKNEAESARDEALGAAQEAIDTVGE